MSTDEKSPLNRGSYMQEYYRKNKARILSQRRNRYQKDQEYRESLNHSRRLSRQLQTEPVKVQSVDIDTEQEKEIDVAHLCKMRVLNPNDKSQSAVVKMYSLSGTALALGIEKYKIESWLYNKKLPLPRYRNKQNWKLYTEDEVEILQKCFLYHRRQCQNNNYQFRLTKALREKIDNRFSVLVGGLNPERYENNDEQ